MMDSRYKLKTGEEVNTQSNEII